MVSTTMDTVQATSFKEDAITESISPQFFVPFLPNLVTVFPSLSSSGKSHLVKRIVKYSKNYFTVSPSKVVFVLCNPKVEAFDDSDFDLSVESVLLQDFVPEECLQHNTLLIFEDVQVLSEKITNCINVYCHHLGLAGIFILVQGLLGRSQVFPLVTISHRIVLFLQSTAVSRLANYILQFYQDPELKLYIKTILAQAQRQEDIVLLEINKVRGTNQPFYVAIQGLDNFPLDSVNKPVIYPQPNKLHVYKKMFATNYAVLSTTSDITTNTTPATNDNLDSSAQQTFPGGSFILVPAENVTFEKNASGQNDDDDNDNDDDNNKCQKTWNNTLNIIKENLENNFHRKKLQLAENLVREIMRTQRFCVTKDGRTVMVKNLLKTKIPLLDLVTNITRQAGPKELPDVKFLPFVKILLENGAPLVYFKNKSLLLKQSLRSSNKTISKKTANQKLKNDSYNLKVNSKATPQAITSNNHQQQHQQQQQQPQYNYHHSINQHQQYLNPYNNNSASNFQQYPSYFLDG